MVIRVKEGKDLLRAEDFLIRCGAPDNVNMSPFRILEFLPTAHLFASAFVSSFF